MASLFPSDYSWAPGDVIALINGSHVSTGHMYSVLDEFIRLYAEVIAVISAHIMVPVTDSRHRCFNGAFDELFMRRGRWNEPPQPPVAIRDAYPVFQAGEKAIVGLADALSQLLSTPAGNPLFAIDTAGLQCYSQSSFLNFGARLCLGEVVAAISVMSSYLQRVTEFLSDEIRERDGKTARQSLKAVQAPKVSEAVRINVHSRSLPTNFSGSMSGGVEDIWDTSLISARMILDTMPLIHKQVYILQNMLNESPKDHRNKVAHIASVLWDVTLRI